MSRFEPNLAAIEELLTGPTGPVSRAVRQFADEVADLAREFAPVEDGLLRESIKVSDEAVRPGKSITLKVGADPIDPRNDFGYGLVAHEGHGVIFAKRDGKGMNFFWFKENRWSDPPFSVVGATEGTPFLTEAVRIVNTRSAHHTEVLNMDGFQLEPGEHEGPIG